MGFEATTTVVVLTLWLALVGYLLSGLRGDGSLSNTAVPPETNETRSGGILAAARTVGERIMSALDDALARFTTFVKSVADQLKNAGDTNATQTTKLAELQSALDAALSNDAADKAQIDTLQAEISSLQDEVAAQINSAIDALSNPLPVVDPVTPPTTPDITVPGIDETGSAPVE